MVICEPCPCSHADRFAALHKLFSMVRNGTSVKKRTYVRVNVEIYLTNFTQSVTIQI